MDFSGRSVGRLLGIFLLLATLVFRPRAMDVPDRSLLLLSMQHLFFEFSVWEVVTWCLVETRILYATFWAFSLVHVVETMERRVGTPAFFKTGLIIAVIAAVLTAVATVIAYAADPAWRVLAYPHSGAAALTIGLCMIEKMEERKKEVPPPALLLALHAVLILIVGDPLITTFMSGLFGLLAGLAIQYREHSGPDVLPGQLGQKVLAALKDRSFDSPYLSRLSLPMSEEHQASSAPLVPSGTSAPSLSGNLAESERRRQRAMEALDMRLASLTGSGGAGASTSQPLSV